MAIQVSDSEKNIIVKSIRNILPDAKILVYGSRVRGVAKKYSDLDISLKKLGKVTYTQLGQIEEVLAQTDIAYKVDLSDFNSLSSDFQKLILDTCVEW